MIFETFINPSPNLSPLAERGLNAACVSAFLPLSLLAGKGVGGIGVNPSAKQAEKMSATKQG
jgi:hypothetical protein